MKLPGDIQSVRAQAESMVAPMAVEYLLGVVEELFPILRGEEHEVDTWGLTLQPSSRFVLAILIDASPRIVSRAQLHVCLCAIRRDGSEPDPKIIDVIISKIRKCLPEGRGSIETVWGQGVRYRRPIQ
ncbi:MAG: hypothetical protein EpisKO_41400 [Epibacterium sp.]